ncbi:MAG: peptidyl-prolyl cis-trans isomerase, EpsD family [Hydrogenophilales bacterium]|nr:peptidyl-prolyl cis-trans isomerase, EpsD family [Hydrogenophilales bacterium]
MKSQRASLAAVLALCMGLSACEQPATSPRDVVAAKIGGDAISEFELGRAVARLGPMNAAESAQARGKVLEALIDQHLVSNAAKDAKLDKAPEVALAMQQAQRQVLVEAYMERLFKDLPPPSDAEVQDYFTRHPELFAQRKLYRIQELELQLPPGRVAEMEAHLKQSRNLSGFTDWLGTQGIAVRSGEAVRPAEKIPAIMLAQLVNMRAGQVVVVPMGENRVSVLQLLGSEAQPVALEQARDAIAGLILSGKRKTLLEAEVRKLRAGGKVEYASGFEPASTQPGKP